MKEPPAPTRRLKLLVGIVVAGLIAGGTGVAVWYWHQAGNDLASELDRLETQGSHGQDDDSHVSSAIPASERLRELEVRLQRDPDNAQLVSEKIHLAIEHAPQAAVDECLRILARSPQNFFALHHAAMAYLEMTNIDRAMHYAGKALQARDAPEVRFVAGHALYAAGDFAGALRHYRIILSRQPQDDHARQCVERAEAALARHTKPATGTGNPP